ncbi:MAG: sulfite exporter TauE/SafE family protein [Planctomycetota bacterium]
MSLPGFIHVPEGVAPWWFVTALLLAAAIQGMAKSGFGGGIGILAVPLVANVLPPGEAIGVLLPMLIVGDIFASYVHRRSVDWPTLRPVLGGSVLGILIGTVVLILLGTADQLTAALNLLVGGICLLMVLVQAWRLAGKPLPRVRPTRRNGTLVGSAVGVASTLAHSAGPVAAIYFLEIKLDKAKLVATAAWLFFLVNLLKLPTYLGLGLINPSTLLQSLWAAAGIPIGSVLGLWLHKRIPEKPFFAIVYLAAAVAAGRMIWKAIGV